MAIVVLGQPGIFLLQYAAMSCVAKSMWNLFKVSIDMEVHVVGMNDDKMYAFVIDTSKISQKMCL